MTEHEGTQNTEAHGSLQSYVIGFALSLLFTLIPYYVVVNHGLRGAALVVVLIGFAIAQLVVQLVFFLHLGREARPRWNLLAFLFAVLVVLIVVIGSLWIMNNLDYNMMAPHELDKHMLHKEGMQR